MNDDNTDLSIDRHQYRNKASQAGTVDRESMKRELISVVQTRRSIRDGFTDRKISDNIITDIINSGLAAPSAKNAQPWKIHVVSNPLLLNKVADFVQEAKNPERYAPIDPVTGKLRKWFSTVVESARILRSVGIGLFIENIGSFSGGKQAVFNTKNDIRQSTIAGYSFEMIGLGAMIENMWLTAHAHSLVGVYMVDILIAEDRIKRLFDIKGDLVGVLALGYSTQKPHPKKLSKHSVIFHQ